MGLFKKLTKTVVDTVLLPVDVLKDAATLGGAVIDKDEAFTKRRLKKILEDLDNAYEELED